MKRSTQRVIGAAMLAGLVTTSSGCTAVVPVIAETLLEFYAGVLGVVAVIIVILGGIPVA